MRRIILFFTDDLLFTISFFIALISCFFGQFSIASIDFKVIFCLFGLMLLVKNIEKLGILTYFADKLIDLSKTSRSLIRNITFLSFFSSMILTNDVAILTLMPIYLTIIKKFPDMKNKLFGAILLIIAANLGSSFFPFGNPQNLFLFSYYNLQLTDFFSWAWWLLLFSLLLLSCSFLLVKKEVIPAQKSSLPQINKLKTLFLALITVLILLSIFNVFPYWLVIPISTFLLVCYDKPMLRAVDYKLLWTFIFFFVAVDNFAQLTVVSTFVKEQFTTSQRTFFGSLLISQFISNVPAAILIAPFTNQAQALFWGVNVGGLGTIIASLANLIGFKLYREYYPKEGRKFLIMFTLVNLCFLFCFILGFLFLL